MSKTILLLGGSRGIGRAIVDLLLERGDQPIVFARHQHDLPQAVPFHQADVVHDDYTSLIPSELDGMIFVPGTITLLPAARLTPQQIIDDFTINAVAAHTAMVRCMPALKRKPGSGVVLFSTVAVSVGMPFHASVAMAKGAVEGLTRSMAAELAPTVRVNAIAPSLTDTPLAAKLLADDKRREASAARHPLQHVGTAREVAQAAVFAACDATWMTGAVLPIDGGMSTVHVSR
jgi:NAD(P)-dependent dehydrogenase (short-subunit alcohol dehydrogenase family)